MKERPIILNTDMVRATLQGRKTQTRRPVKLTDTGAWICHAAKAVCVPTSDRGSLDYQIMVAENPFGNPGDRLWVRETWGIQGNGGMSQTEFFKEFPDLIDKYGVGIISYKEDSPHCLRWWPSIHMPRWACRLVLEVINVRVEKLQEITEIDAFMEGVAPLFSYQDIHNPRYRAELDLKPMPYRNYLWHGNFRNGEGNKKSDLWDYQFSSYNNARDSFSSLWELIYGAGAWAKNPWVWVIDYRVIESPHTR